MKKARLVGLDIFRIMAALIIMLFHSSLHIGCNYGIIHEFIMMGPVFMTAFFMLSGFSCYYVNEDKDLTNLSNVYDFYKKRVIAILPMYYIASIIYVVFLGKESVLQNIILLPVEVLGIQSTFATLFPFSHNGGTWFVSCILICYFVFPLIQNCIKQLKTKSKIILLCVSAGILFWAPLVVWKFSVLDVYSNPFFRTLEFIIGAILASTLKDIRSNLAIKKFLLNKVAIILELVIMFMSITIAYKLDISRNNYMLYSWICLPLFCLLIPAFACSNWCDRINNSKLISRLSKWSYAFFDTVICMADNNIFGNRK